jgi:hypothetical protein
MEDLMQQFIAMPKRGTPAAKLTSRDRLALALAAGAPYTISMLDCKLTVATAVPVGIADRGDGGYIVAIGGT